MPPCHYVAKSVEAQYEHCKFFATGVDFDHGGIVQNWQGGGDVSLLTHPTDLLEYFVSKKQIEKTRGGFFGSYDS